MPPQAGLTVGEVFADHRIEAEIGRGGMGIVYRARHLVLNRDVALKVIAPHLAADAGFVGRFKKESIVAAGIDHPNVIPIYHAGEADGTYFITMRLVPGTDLRAFLTDRGALDPATALRILRPLASALDAAHRHALVHRDVKPGNVLLREPIEDFSVYLTDFGLTKRTISGGGITKTGQVVGTFDYVAPEQIQSGRVDNRTDIYSLGCVFYEMLVGNVPFPHAEDAAKLWAHMSSDPPSVAGSRPELPPALDAAVSRAMAKDPEDRFESAGAFSEAAAAAVTGSTVAPAHDASVPAAPSPVEPPSAPPASPTPSEPEPSEPPPPPPVAAPDRAGRRWLRPLLIAAPIVLILVVLSIVVLGGGGASGPSAVSVGQTPSDVAVGEGSVWVVNSGEGTLSRVDPASRKTVGDKIPVGDNPEHVAVGAGAVWVARSGGSGSQLVRVDPTSGARSANAVNLDGSVYGLAAGHGAAWVADGRTAVLRVDASTGAVKRIRTGNAPTDVAVGGGFVWVVNSGDGTVVGVDPSSQRRTEGPIDVAPRSNAIAVSGNDVWVLDPETSKVIRIDAGPGHAVDPPLSAAERPVDIAAGGGFAWVVVPDARQLLRFKAGSGTPATKRLSQAPRSVAFGEGAVWLTEDTANRLLRIDPGGVR